MKRFYNLFRGIGAIHSALGTDLGISHATGLDKTCYYAINSESAAFVGWNYHDGSLYAGIIGGYNPGGGSHNQIDSGYTEIIPTAEWRNI